MDNIFDLKGQVALITGGSAGLGVQMANALARQGADIALTARRKELMDVEAQKIRDKYRVKVLTYKADITKLDEVKATVQATLDKYGKIDILVNNAGSGAVKPSLDFTDEEFLETVDVDTLGVFRMSREVGRHMIERRYGRIINIASIFGMVSNMVTPSIPYQTAKGGTINMTRALAAEWSKYGITVNAICPGAFETEISRAQFEREEFRAFIQSTTPLGRQGLEGELDTTICYLASPKTSYTTGVILPVDGGCTCI